MAPYLEEAHRLVGRLPSSNAIGPAAASVPAEDLHKAEREAESDGDRDAGGGAGVAEPLRDHAGRYVR